MIEMGGRNNYLQVEVNRIGIDYMEVVFFLPVFINF
jgi:hypothetical protein